MKKIILFFVFLVLLVSTVSAATITRSVPSTANKGSTFTVTYTATSVSGKWGASIEESVSGGCKFPSGESTYKSVMLSDDGNTKTITMSTPNTDSTCGFTGDYKFGTDPIQNFPNAQVVIGSGAVCTPNWQCGSWSSCVNNQQTRTCTDTNNCGTTSGKPSESQSCETGGDGEGIKSFCEGLGSVKLGEKNISYCIIGAVVIVFFIFFALMRR